MRSGKKSSPDRLSIDCGFKARFRLGVHSCQTSLQDRHCDRAVKEFAAASG